MAVLEEKRVLFHQIRNCLNPLQTFLEVVETDEEGNPKLKEFHQECKEKILKLGQLLDELEKH